MVQQKAKEKAEINLFAKALIAIDFPNYFPMNINQCSQVIVGSGDLY